VVFAIGCGDSAPAVVHPRSASYGCSGTPDIVFPPPQVPTGRVEVRSLGDGPDGPRIKILAERAPASQIAIRIGEALGVITRVDRELDTIPISINFPDITVDLLGAMLRSYKVRVSKPDWQNGRILVFRLTDAPEVEAVETQFVTPVSNASPEQLASLFCRSVASPAGWAQVVGTRVMIGDRRSYLDRFDRILERLDSGVPQLITARKSK
jgi:hypothetical protein